MLVKFLVFKLWFSARLDFLVQCEAIIKPSVSCALYQLGRRVESMVLPLELLQQLKPADFPNQKEYEAWKRRNLKLLEAGLLLHPHLPLNKADAAPQRLHQIIRGALDKPIDSRKNSESMQVLRSAVMLSLIHI